MAFETGIFPTDIYGEAQFLHPYRGWTPVGVTQWLEILISNFRVTNARLNESAVQYQRDVWPLLRACEITWRWQLQELYRKQENVQLLTDCGDIFYSLSSLLNSPQYQFRFFVRTRGAVWPQEETSVLDNASAEYHRSLLERLLKQLLQVENASLMVVREEDTMYSHNLALLDCVADLISTKSRQANENPDMLSRMNQAIMSLNKRLGMEEPDDSTILGAILITLIAHVRGNVAEAQMLARGVQTLIASRPNFNISSAIGQCMFAPGQSTQPAVLARPELHQICSFLVSIGQFRTNPIHDNSNEFSGDNSHAAATAAFPAFSESTQLEQPGATPAADSPWSETDGLPPPYMLSPTPLKEACLIYASIANKGGLNGNTNDNR